MRTGPSPSATRVELIDALRGFALAGVLLVNSRELSLFGFLTDDARTMLVTAKWDQILGPIVGALVEKKALTIFTILFGIGFAMQTERAPFKIYARRLGILFGIGVIHSVFFYGDILRYYAVIGFLLIPAARLRPWLLAAIGVAVALIPWPAFARSYSFPDEMMASPLLAFSGSSLWRMLRANWSYDSWLINADWGFPLALLGRFLIGVAIGRSRVLFDVRNHLRFWNRLLITTLPIGAVLTAFVFFRDGGDLPISIDQLLLGITSLTLGLGYIAAFALLFQLPLWHRWMQPLAPFGRMALTNYLFLTLAGIGVFYGIGLGIGPRFGLVGVLTFAVLLFSWQINASRWWLTRFNFGPVEWLWRCLTYGTILKLRKDAAIPAP